jgi:hypothetical protein
VNRTKLAWRFGICLYSDGCYGEAEVQFVEAFNREKRVLAGASGHADQHGQSGTDVPESRTMERGGSDRDEKEGVRAGASFYFNQHE